MKVTEITNLTIPPSRIATLLDSDLNEAFQAESKRCTEALETLKKTGKAKPEHPKALGAKAEKSEKVQHAKEMEEYQNQMKVYRSYTSKEFSAVKAAYQVVVKLQRINALLAKPLDKDGKKGVPLTAAETSELSQLKAELTGTMRPRGEDETDASFEKRQSKFKAANYPALIRGADGKVLNLNNRAEVQAHITKMLTTDARIKLFLENKGISTQRYRSSEQAPIAIATSAQIAVRQLIEFAFHSQAMANNGVKTLSPEHLDGIDEAAADPEQQADLCYYTLLRDMPHMKAVKARSLRRAAYMVSHDNARKQHAIKHKRELKRVDGLVKRARDNASSKGEDESEAAKAIRKNAVFSTFKYPSFEEVEAENGHAICVAQTYKDKDGANQTRKLYYWHNIDAQADGEEEKSDLVHYAKVLCDSVREDLASIYPNIDTVIISKSMKRFISNIIIDYAKALVAQIDIRANPTTTAANEVETKRKIKTVKYELVVDIVKQLLVFTTGQLTEDQEGMINDMNEKAKALKTHRTTRSNTKHAANGGAGADVDADEDAEADANDDDADEVDDAEEAPASAAPTKATKVVEAAPTKAAAANGHGKTVKTK
jgi:hypothetical protein